MSLGGGDGGEPHFGLQKTQGAGYSEGTFCVTEAGMGEHLGVGKVRALTLITRQKSISC